MHNPPEHPESALGIEYAGLVSEPLLPLIVKAEAEWLENAPETYGNDAGEVWAGDVLPRLLRAELQDDIDLLDLRLYAPVFLEAVIGQSPENLDDDTLRDALSVFRKAG